MALWLILLLVWLGGIPAAIVATAVLGSRWQEHKLARAARAYRRRAALMGFDQRCGARGHAARIAAWSYRRAAGRRPV
jgi:hypothetical protein